MNFKKQCKNSFYILSIMIGLISCSFNSNKITNVMPINDISSDTKYLDIISKGYMGGSLIYNEEDNSLGQLANGVSVAIRLSKSQRYDTSETESVFKEEDGSVIYGLLVIDKIDSEKISFKSELYDITGNAYLEKTFLLYKNECADLNDDGLVDIQYTKPYSKRSGYEKAMYLNFLSSQENLNITMFAVLIEQYPGKTYPNGIIGVNNDDKFIVQKYVNTETAQRSVVSGVYKGDYVVDNLNNKYQIISNNQYARHARSVSDDDLIDLDSEIEDENTIFQFIEEDFAFSTVNDFLSSLPKKIVDKYNEYEGIEKLNEILKDKELLKIIDEEQGSILPANEKEEIFNQFDFLTVEETIQLNRVFLEKNYPVSCPQRVTVSTVITEVLPLASIVFTESDTHEDIVEESSTCDIELPESENRAASASFSKCKTEEEYYAKLDTLENDFNSYNKFFSRSDFKIPICKDKTVDTKLVLKNSRIALGIKGSFSSTWGSVRSSLGAAVFFKATANVGVEITKTSTNNTLTKDYQGTETDAQIKNKSVTIPIIKKDLTLCEFELCQSTNLANFAIGPILIGINLDLGIGLPIKTTFEMDCELSYSAHIAGLAKAGISVGVDYGIKWKKMWFIRIPRIYIDWIGNASASAEAICFFDQDFESLDLNLSKLALQFSVEPYVKAGISVSVAAVVHAGCGIQFGTKGYVNFGYYNPYIKGSYGLDNTSSIYANVFLGLKGVKVLGISICEIGKEWEWVLFENKTPIIPETKLFEYKVN